MKKNHWFLIAICMAVGASVLQSYASKPASIDPTASQTSYSWYPVNTLNQIASTTPALINKTKSAAIAAQACKDIDSPICLYGTNGSVVFHQDVGSEPSSQTILRNF